MLARLFRPDFGSGGARPRAPARRSRRVRARPVPVALVGAFALLGGGAAVAQTVPTGLPSDGTFVRGQGQISQTSPTSLGIVQTTDRGVIDWRAFAIADGHQVNIDNGQGATLNRVMGGQLSRIDGLLSATGSVYLMNPSGVIVGPGGRVVTNGNFVASTREMDPDAFMAGGPLTAAGRSSGAIVNQGEVVSRNGSVVMIARSIENHGRIEAPNGRATLAAADDVLLATTDGAAENIYVAVGGGGGDITQDGRIQAAAVALQAAGGNIFALAGNRDGLIQATGTATVDGQLWLTAPNGAIEVSGALAATDADGSGGAILVNGDTVRLAPTAHLAATGSRGGEIVVGADAFGSGEGLAEETTIASGATLLAGSPSGPGRIETSGRALDLGAARVDAGLGGEWLIDPDDLTIDAAAATALTGSLNAGTNVTQATTAGGTGGVGDITVAAPVVWTGTGSLTLNAYRDLRVAQTIAGGGGVTLIAGRDAAIGAAVSGTTVNITAVNGLTIGAAGQVTGSGAVRLAAGFAFTNQSGADALNSTGGDWLVYSGNPANDTTGGLAPDFYQYNAAAGAAPAAAGNGLLYRIAPSVSFTLGAVTRAYDGTTVAPLDDTNTVVTGLINDDDWLLDGTYATKDAGTGISVTATNFRATHNGAPVFGYAVSTPTVTVNTGVITRAQLTALIVGNPTKTYNGTTTATLTSANYALAGVAAGETITVNGAASVAYNSANAGVRTVNAAFAPSNFTAGAGVNLNNYVLPTTAAGLGRINQALLTITNVLANDKVYDGNTNATLNTANAGLFGIVGSDAVTLNSAGATGTFATRNAGTDIQVTASGFTLGGGAAANYALQPLLLAADITRATLSVVNFVVNDKVYDGTTSATFDASGATLTGLIAGDDARVSGAGASINFVTKDVGQNIPVAISGLSLTGADAGNYTLAQPSGTAADITPRPLFGAIIGNPTRVYNGTNNAVVGAGQYILTGFAPGEGATVTQASGAQYASPNAGTWIVTAQVSAPDFIANPGTLLSNYSLPTTATGLGTITRAPLLINIIGNPTKPYDGNDRASLTPANFEMLGFIAGEGGVVTQTVGRYASSDAGLWGVTADLNASFIDPNAGTLLSNYIIPTQANGFGTITRIDINGFVVAFISGNPTRIYDGTTVATLTPADYTLSGFLEGEGAIITETVGEYAGPDAGQQPVIVFLTPDDFAPFPNTNLDNYNLPTQATGIGTILRAPLTAAIIGNPTRVYNGSTRAVLNAANYSFAGFVAGEGVTLAPGIVASYDSDNAGARTVTAQFTTTSLVPNTGTRLANYILPTSATGPGTITPAPLVIVGVSARDRVYDATNIAQLNLGGATLFGVVEGDNISLNTSGASATFATPNVGVDIAVDATGFAITGIGQSNYQLFQPENLFADITPRGLTLINVLALDKIYDATTLAILDSSGASLSGIIAGDTVGFAAGGATGVFEQANVGIDLSVATSGYTLVGADAGNYRLSQPSLVADITPRPLTAAIIGNPTKIYDGTTAATLTSANFSLAGFVGGQGASLTQAANARYAQADAGARTVLANVVVSDFTANAGTDLSNYLLPTTIQGPGTINPALLTATIVGNPTRVYNNTTVATLTPANYQLSGFVSGQGASATETVGAYDSDNVGSRTVTAALGAGDFTGNAGTNLANYVLPTTARGAGTITPASVTVINVQALDKVYDGTTVAQLNTTLAALSGVFAGDAVNVVSTNARGTFATRNVGVNIPVTATGFTIAGVDAINYTVIQPSGLSANIAQALISLASVTRVYNAGVNLPTASSAYGLSGVFSGDNVFVNTAGLGGAYADKNVGTGKLVTVTGLTLGGTDAGNYLIDPTVTNAPIGVITPATLNIIGVLAQDKVYDRTTLATLLNGGAALSGVLGTDVVVLNTGASTGAFNDFNVGTNKPVTASGYTVSGLDAPNYTLVQPQGLTADITPLQIFLTSVARVYNGTFALPTTGAGYGFSGVIAGDTVVADVTNVSGGYASRNVGGTLSGGVVTNGINVNLTGLALTGSSAGNYFINPSSVGQPIGVITPAQLTAAIINNPTRVYNGSSAALLGPTNFQLTGFVVGEGATVTETAGVYNSINQGARTVTAALQAADFTATGATLLSNYILPTSASGAGTITPRPLTISGVLATDRVYNGATLDVLNVANASLVNVVAGDTVALNSAGAIGNFATPDVGVNKPVTATGFTLINNTAGNYTLSQPTGLFADITQALINLVSVTRVYTAGVALPTNGGAYVLSGVVSGDVVHVNTAGLTGSYASKNVGSNINVTLGGLSLTGADAANYSIAPTLTNAPIGFITPATVSLANILANSKIYDGTTLLTLNNTNASLVGVLGTDDLGVNVSGSTAAFPSANVGSYSVNASGYVLTGADAANYILTQPTGLSASITPAALVALITGNPTRVYDATTAAVLASNNYVLTGLVAGQGATVTETTGTYASPDAGVRVVTASLTPSDFLANAGTLLSNYTLPTTAVGPGTITAAPLTIAIVGNPTRVYDGTNLAVLTPANYALSGFIGGQGATVTETVGTYSSPNAGARTVTAALTATNYAATGSTNLSNYILPTTASGPGQINRAALTAAIIGNPTRAYDGTTLASLTSSNFQLGGFVAGQGANVTETVGTYGSPNAGPRTVTASLTDTDFTANAGTALSNYILPTTATGLGTINPRLLVAAIIGDPTRAYDGTTVANLTSANFSVGGFVAGQGVTVTETVGTYSSRDAGLRTVTAALAADDFTPTAGTLLSNYVLPVTATGIGHIDRALLNAVIIGLPTRPYDGTTLAVLTPANYALTGFAAGEGATVTQTAGTYASPNAGFRGVTAGLAPANFTADNGTLLTNYVLPTSASGAGIIQTAQLTAAIIGNPTRTYDGTRLTVLTPANYVLTGFVAGEGATITDSRGIFDSPNAGPRTVTALLGSSDFVADPGTLLTNYALPIRAVGPGQINPATLLAVIVGNPTRVYDGSTTATLAAGNFSLTGFIGSETATITETVGTYSSANAGPRIVTAQLGSEDFVAGAGTLLSNYRLPTSAAGLGTIDRALLTAAIIGNPTRAYNGTDIATLTPANFALGGFVAGEGASVTETFGLYDAADAGPRTVSAVLDAGDFAADAGTLLSNYILPTSATGAGQIGQAALVVSIIDNPTRVYDGTTFIGLTPGNFSISGFIGGDGAGVTQTVGAFDSPNAGGRTITAALAPGQFTPTGSTILANYALPSLATGPGVITRALLSAALVGNPTRAYDGTNLAALGPANFLLTGFISGEGATVTETTGLYDSPNAGSRIVTAALQADDFAPQGSTLLDNYVLPTSATGAGQIDRALLTAAIVGNPARTYDGTNLASLIASNFALTGFAPGEGAIVTETEGRYDSANAGPRTVTAVLGAEDFTASGATLFSNYILPTSAAGPGQIDPAALIATIIGTPTRVYDGTSVIGLTSGNFVLTGFIGADGATVTETVGTFDSPNAGARTVTAALDASDFTPTGATVLGNYALPTTAAGPGLIERALLTAAIVGNPTRDYDGTNIVFLASGDYALSGFAAGEGATVVETTGLFDSANAGARTVRAVLAADDFLADGSTLLSNYILPTDAVGTGQIDPADVFVTITGNPTRPYNGGVDASLTSDDYTVTGFVAGEGAAITQTQGFYDSPGIGVRTVTASLALGDYDPLGGTLLSNYNLPTSATGPGQILPPPEPCRELYRCLDPDRFLPFGRITTNPRFYIPYPASDVYAGHTNGFGGLPGILRPPPEGEAVQGVIDGGPPVLNTTESILLQGARNKRWTIRFTPRPTEIGLAGTMP